MTIQHHHEPLLHWLQEFYATQIDHESLPGFISDELIRLDRWSFKSIPNSPQLLKIFIASDPAWYIKFGISDTKKVEDFLLNNSIITSQSHQINFDSCFDAKIDNNMLFLFSTPLYLVINLEALRCYIEDQKFNMKEIEKNGESIAHHNPLLN